MGHEKDFTESCHMVSVQKVAAITITAVGESGSFYDFLPQALHVP